MRTIEFSSFDNEKFSITCVPDDATIELRQLKDAQDGHIQQLVISHKGSAIATFSSIVSFFDSSLKFDKLTGSKEYIP